MSLQVIHSIHGIPEFVLLPMSTFEKLPAQLKAELSEKLSTDYEPFILEEYIQNPVALARMKAQVTQKALAKAMHVSQAYISQLEIQKAVTPKTLDKVLAALSAIKLN